MIGNRQEPWAPADTPRELIARNGVPLLND